jgi:hypothetical protein
MASSGLGLGPQRSEPRQGSQPASGPGEPLTPSLAQALRVPALLYGGTIGVVLVVNVVAMVAFVNHVLTTERPAVAVAPPGEPSTRVQREGPPQEVPATTGTAPQGDLSTRVQQRLAADSELKHIPLARTEVSLQGGLLRLAGVVPRTGFKARLEQEARAAAEELQATVSECRNELKSPLDLLRSSFPLPPKPQRFVLLTDAALQSDVLVLRGVVERRLQDEVTATARARTEAAFGVTLSRCDTSGLQDLCQVVAAALPPGNKSARLMDVRIVEREEDGKTKRVVVLTGTSPSRRASRDAAETAVEVLEKLGLTIDYFDKSQLVLNPAQSKSK